MKPVEFAESTHCLAEDQPEYLPLPVHVDVQDPTVPVTSCWELTAEELAQLQANGGRIYVRQLTFGQLLQPQLLTLEPPMVTRGTA